MQQNKLSAEHCETLMKVGYTPIFALRNLETKNS